MSRTDRRAQITSAALDLFKRKGFADVSTRDLADHAGLSRSHLYHYFSDWNELRREVLISFAQEQHAKLSAAIEGVTGAQALHEILRFCLPVSIDSEWMLWLDAWDEAMHEPGLAVTYLRINGEWQEMLAVSIEQGVATKQFECAAPRRVARQLFALAMGYANDLLLQPSAEAAAQALAEVTEVARLLLSVPVAAAADGRGR